jgi:hypothetical protein
MTILSTPEDIIAECKRRADECHTLSDTTVVPEYRKALLAMAKAWMKIAQVEREHRSNQQATQDRLQVPSRSTAEPSGRISEVAAKP